VPGGIHHSVVVRELEASLRLYRDGLGLDLLQDRQVEGDWPDLFDAPSRRVRAVFLGDAGVSDDHAGVLELNVFDGDILGSASCTSRRTCWQTACCHSGSRPMYSSTRESARTLITPRLRNGRWAP